VFKQLPVSFSPDISLWPELLLLFKLMPIMLTIGGIIWNYHHHIFNVTLESDPTTPFLMKLPFP